MLDLKDVTAEWTLFLDRDGVINREKHMDYVLHADEFIFYDGVPEALAALAERFSTIVIVTNQRGVEKKLMSVEDLLDLHRHMQVRIKESGGRIDAIYYCTSLDDAHPNRKPQPGMAWLAKQQFPAIDFSTSIMVGNNLSDMEFGRNAGMKTVFVQTTSHVPLPHQAIDLAVKDLPSFASALESAR